MDNGKMPELPLLPPQSGDWSNHPELLTLICFPPIPCSLWSLLARYMVGGACFMPLGFRRYMVVHLACKFTLLLGSLLPPN
jgi:hypothetical protein